MEMEKSPGSVSENGTWEEREEKEPGREQVVGTRLCISVRHRCTRKQERPMGFFKKLN